jgi:hypothetical protein
MNSNLYKDFVRDLAVELVQLTRDPTIYEEDNDFNRGYRAALYSAIHVLEEQLEAWEIGREEVGLDFRADEWRRIGKGYLSSSE